MSHIVACYKWVLDESDIRFHNDRTLDIKGAKKRSVNTTAMPFNWRCRSQKPPVPSP